MIYGASAYGQVEYGGIPGILSSSTLSVTVFDLISVGEDIALSIPALFISNIEALSVSEDFRTTGQDYGIDFETLTVSDYILIVIPLLLLSVSDSVTVSDYPSVNIPVLIYTFDSLTVSENVLLREFLWISAFDSISITENSGLLIPILIVYNFEQVLISDNPILSVLSRISVYDSLTVSESIALSIPLPVIAYDSVTISENMVLRAYVLLSIFQDVFITESISLTIPILFVSQLDSINVVENTSIVSICNIGVSDITSVYDTFTGETAMRGILYPFPSGYTLFTRGLVYGGSYGSI